MSDLPQVYRRYDLLFTPRLISKLRDLRGEEWAKFVDSFAGLPDTHPDALSLAMMIIQLGGCLSCEMDSYRAQRGCALCSRQTVLSFKGTDQQLIKRYESARKLVHQHLADSEGLKKAA